jgi:hypothetical protein
LRILEVPRAVGVRSQIQDWVLKYQGLDDHLSVQERSDAKFGVDPRHLDNITGRKYRRVLHPDTINVNRQREKRERQPSDFNLLSSFFLEIGDDMGPVAIHVHQSGYNENEREQDYRSDSHNDQTGACQQL